MNTKPTLSIIIPCLNEERHVPKLLTDLTQQTEGNDYEVIVIDSNSDDDTMAVAQTFSDELPLTTVAMTERGASKARNAGAEAAKGTYLLFLDADVRVSRDFLRVLLLEQRKHEADMMSTRFRASGLHPFDRLFYFATSRYFEKSFQTEEPLMSGCVQFTSATHHRTVGGYKETQTVGEDVDYSRRVGKVALQPHFVPQLKVVASNRRFNRDGRLTMFLRQYQWVSGRKLERETLDAFEFGHYGAGEKPLRFRHVFTRPDVRRDTLKAIRFFVGHTFSR